MKKMLTMAALLMALTAHGQTEPPNTTGPLAGTFALKVVTTGKIDLPIIGEKTPRGHILFLLTRQWNADKSHYTQKAKMCDGTSGSIFGVTTEVSRTGYQRIPPSHSVLKVKEDKQTITVKNEVFLWGMKNLPSPLTATLPQSMEEAQSAKFKNIVYDVDADGQMRMWNAFHGDSSCGEHVNRYVNRYARNVTYDAVGEEWIDQAYDRDWGSNNDDCPTSIVFGSTPSRRDSMYEYGGWRDRKNTGSRIGSTIYYVSGCDPSHGSTLP